MYVICMYVCVCVCVYVCMYVCICMYVWWKTWESRQAFFVHVHTHYTHTHTPHTHHTTHTHTHTHTHTPHHSYQNPAESHTGDNTRQVSFLISDGAFNSSTLACIQLVGVNDPPQLTLGPNGTVDTMVMYTEGQTQLLTLAPIIFHTLTGSCRFCFIYHMMFIDKLSCLQYELLC